MLLNHIMLLFLWKKNNTNGDFILKFHIILITQKIIRKLKYTKTIMDFFYVFYRKQL
jgi:hypothetical protein